MRYSVESKKLDKDHPNWPNETVYHVVEIATGKMSLGCYTTVDAAMKIAARKNAE